MDFKVNDKRTVKKPAFVNDQTVKPELTMMQEIEKARKALYNKMLNEEIKAFVDEHRETIIKRTQAKIRLLKEQSNDSTSVGSTSK